MKVGLVIGRFQPLHNGHVALIQKAYEENDVVLVLVGSANELTNYKNPFTVEERIGLIEAEFSYADRLHVKGINNYPSDNEWIQDVIGRVNTIEEDPTEVSLYTSEKDEDFYGKSFLYGLKVVESEGLNATDIRAHLYCVSIQRVENRVNDVPENTKDFLLEFHGTPEWLRLRNEYVLCHDGRQAAIESHKYSNPIEPVVHAMVIQGDECLLVKRGGGRGHGQWALAGGFLNCDEATRAGALRELKEETGLDLMNQSRAAEVAFAVEENLNGLSTRTIAFNYCYAVHPSEVLKPIAGDDAQEVKWFPIKDIVEGKMPLFYNHVTIIRRLVKEIK